MNYSIRNGWLHLARGTAIGRILSFLANLMLSRFLGPANLGIFNIATTTIQTAETLTRCGSDFALNYEIGGLDPTVSKHKVLEIALAASQICSVATFLSLVIIQILPLIGFPILPENLMHPGRANIILLISAIVFFECICSPAWEVLLATHRTKEFAIRNGIAIPLRILAAALAGYLLQVEGALSGFLVVTIAQSIWLKIRLGKYWQPLNITVSRMSLCITLLRRGSAFYFTNLASSLVFYPLLLLVSAGNGGLANIGFIRAGQILQQLFAFIPATLVPIFFLHLRRKKCLEDQMHTVEEPLRLIWLVMLITYLLYCLSDHVIVFQLFGKGYEGALNPTRVLLLISLIESLTQILSQPFLASGHTNTYALIQNGSTAISALFGFSSVQYLGINSFLLAKLIYCSFPLAAFFSIAFKYIDNKQALSIYVLFTAALAVLIPCDILANHAVMSPQIRLATNVLSLMILIFSVRTDLSLLFSLTTDSWLPSTNRDSKS